MPMGNESSKMKAILKCKSKLRAKRIEALRKVKASLDRVRLNDYPLITLIENFQRIKQNMKEKENNKENMRNDESLIDAVCDISLIKRKRGRKPKNIIKEDATNGDKLPKQNEDLLEKMINDPVISKDELNDLSVKAENTSSSKSEKKKRGRKPKIKTTGDVDILNSKDKKSNKLKDKINLLDETEDISTVKNKIGRIKGHKQIKKVPVKKIIKKEGKLSENRDSSSSGEKSTFIEEVSTESIQNDDSTYIIEKQKISSKSQKPKNRKKGDGKKLLKEKKSSGKVSVTAKNKFFNPKNLNFNFEASEATVILEDNEIADFENFKNKNLSPLTARLLKKNGLKNIMIDSNFTSVNHDEDDTTYANESENLSFYNLTHRR